MKLLKTATVSFIKKLDLASALAVRLTKLTGKSPVPIHPKHLIRDKLWFADYFKKQDLVLDLGCGNGQYSIKSAKYVKKIVALDINKEMIEIATRSAKSKSLKNIIFKQGDLESKLNFKDRSFNTVLFLDVLEHLKKRDQILAEIKRILKPNGTLVLGVPNSETSWKKAQRSVGICSFSDPDHKVEFSEKSIRRLLEKHNFKILEFGYGKYDIPMRGIIDIVGAFSLSFYKVILKLRKKLTGMRPKEAAGFEIVCLKLK